MFWLLVFVVSPTDIASNEYIMDNYDEYDGVVGRQSPHEESGSGSDIINIHYHIEEYVWNDEDATKKCLPFGNWAAGKPCHRDSDCCSGSCWTKEGHCQVPPQKNCVPDGMDCKYTRKPCCGSLTCQEKSFEDNGISKLCLHPKPPPPPPKPKCAKAGGRCHNFNLPCCGDLACQSQFPQEASSYTCGKAMYLPFPGKHKPGSHSLQQKPPKNEFELPAFA